MTVASCGPVRRLTDRFELSRGDATNLRPMEGLRGVAVTLVFLVHFQSLGLPWMVPDSAVSAVFEALHSVGNAGVDLFFVLSGYLIYGTLIQSNKPFGVYFARRVRRIYPAFLAVFAMYVTLNYAVPAEARKIPAQFGEALPYLLGNLLLLPGVFPLPPLITVAWSLSYEMLYYLAMPASVALLGLRSRSPRWRLTCHLLLLVAALLLAGVFGGPVRLSLFLFGVLLFDRQQQQRDGPPRIGSIGAIVIAALALASTALPMPGPNGQALRCLILGAGFYVLCRECFSQPKGLSGRMLSWAPLRWLGNMSYSYYLIHGLALHIAFRVCRLVLPAQPSDFIVVVLLVPAFAFTLLVSALLFLAVERPLSLVVRPAVS